MPGLEGRYVCPSTRDEMVRWLIKLTDQYQFHPETFSLSVALLDHFLTTVKASPRYTKVITLTCFFLASKIQEEDETIPSTLDLVAGTGCICSVPELLRMERLILDKLHWNLSEVTPLDYLHIFHSLLLLTQPQLLAAYSHMTPGHQLSALTTKLKLCLTHHELVTVRPAVLALSLLSLELEWYTSNWLAHIVMLQRMAMVDCEQVILCREMISVCLSECRYKNIVYRYSPEAMNKRAKRKVSESDEDVYDGIKRMYSEDCTDCDVITESQHRTCAQEAQSCLLVDCPSLQNMVTAT